jgi:protein SCO1/2
LTGAPAGAAARARRPLSGLGLGALLSFVLGVVLAPGSGPAVAGPFRTNDITEAGFAIRGLELTDHSGRKRTLAEFKGKVVVIAFGFTSCPDVCPTTLAEFAAVLRTLGGDAQRVQVLFMTLDPERDTAQVLSAYVPAFHPSFIGLRGSAVQTREVAREFRVFYRKVGTGTAGSYTIDHSTHSYVFGPDGRLRLFLRMGAPAADIAHDLRLLLAE